MTSNFCQSGRIKVNDSLRSYPGPNIKWALQTVPYNTMTMAVLIIQGNKCREWQISDINFITLFNETRRDCLQPKAPNILCPIWSNGKVHSALSNISIIKVTIFFTVTLIAVTPGGNITPSAISCSRGNTINVNNESWPVLLQYKRLTGSTYISHLTGDKKQWECWHWTETVCVCLSLSPFFSSALPQWELLVVDIELNINNTIERARGLSIFGLRKTTKLFQFHLKLLTRRVNGSKRSRNRTNWGLLMLIDSLRSSQMGIKSQAA